MSKFKNHVLYHNNWRTHWQKKLLRLSLTCLLISGSKEGKRPLTSGSTLASKSPKTLGGEGKVYLCMTEFITVSVLTIASTAIVEIVWSALLTNLWSGLTPPPAPTPPHLYLKDTQDAGVALIRSRDKSWTSLVWRAFFLIRACFIFSLS